MMTLEEMAAAFAELSPRERRVFAKAVAPYAEHDDEAEDNQNPRRLGDTSPIRLAGDSAHGGLYGRLFRAHVRGDLPSRPMTSREMADFHRRWPGTKNIEINR